MKPTLLYLLFVCIREKVVRRKYNIGTATYLVPRAALPKLLSYAQDIISITACTFNISVLRTFCSLLLTMYHLPVHTAVLTFQLLILQYTVREARHISGLTTTASGLKRHTRPSMQYSAALKKYVSNDSLSRFSGCGGCFYVGLNIFCVSESRKNVKSQTQSRYYYDIFRVPVDGKKYN